jgi:hypothetical protein
MNECGLIYCLADLAMREAVSTGLVSRRLGGTTIHPFDRAQDDKLQDRARCRSLTSLR